MTAPRAAKMPPGLAPRPAPDRGSPAADDAAAHLHLVGDPRAGRRRHRLTRTLTALATTAAAAGLFATVCVNVLLAQGQVQLDRLQAQAATETARNQRLRVEVAELESPSRVVAAARQRLGMVTPPTVTYLDGLSDPQVAGLVLPVPTPTAPPAAAVRPAPPTTARPSKATPTTAPARPPSTAAHPAAPATPRSTLAATLPGGPRSPATTTRPHTSPPTTGTRPRP